MYKKFNINSGAEAFVGARSSNDWNNYHKLDGISGLRVNGRTIISDFTNPGNAVIDNKKNGFESFQGL
jgi:hypothetical protein